MTRERAYARLSHAARRTFCRASLARAAIGSARGYHTLGLRAQERPAVSAAQGRKLVAAIRWLAQRHASQSGSCGGRADNAVDARRGAWF
jgi:hypothetical protein